MKIEITSKVPWEYSHTALGAMATKSTQNSMEQISLQL
jgi:hypothetical protein